MDKENQEPIDKRRKMLEDFLRNKRHRPQVKKDFVVRKVDPLWTAVMPSYEGKHPRRLDSSKPRSKATSPEFQQIDESIFKNLNHWMPRSFWLSQKVFLRNTENGKLSRVYPPTRSWFTLEDAAQFAQKGQENVARAIFDILASPGQALQRDITRSSHYWISRARFEEKLGNEIEVMRIFNKAEEIDCQPMEEIVRAKKCFEMRIKEDEDENIPEEIQEVLCRHKELFTPSKPIEKPKESVLSRIASSINSLGGKKFLKQINESPEKRDSTITVLTPVRASRKERKELGIESVVTPVRRSRRNWKKQDDEQENKKEMLEKLLEETDYAYTPNKALGSVHPDHVLLTPGNATKKRKLKFVENE